MRASSFGSLTQLRMRKRPKQKSTRYMAGAN